MLIIHATKNLVCYVSPKECRVIHANFSIFFEILILYISHKDVMAQWAIPIDTYIIISVSMAIPHCVSDETV